MACHDKSCAPPPVGKGGSAAGAGVARKIGLLKTLADHPNTPPHEATAARARMNVLLTKYAKQIKATKEAAKPKPSHTQDWLKKHFEESKKGPQPGTKAFNDLVKSKIAKSNARTATIRPKARNAFGSW